ncbi:MAG: S-layer homology domain-containing protein, partial [Oscillospiraceae bacterium]|nr:S-layer homology domain-containing protein [Oscillospiraceae bacterium]
MADNRLKTNPLICALLASVIAAPLPPAAASAADAPFTDVPASEWYYNDVMIAYESGLINGSTATTFSPDDNLTYA